jgi:hypothetical protein
LAPRPTAILARAGRIVGSLSSVVLLAAPAVAQGTAGPPPEVRSLRLEPDEAGDDPVALAFVRGGSEVAVLHRATADVTFFDARSGELAARLVVGGDPSALGTTSDGLTLLVVDRADTELVWVDVVARTVIRRQSLPTATPRTVLVTPDDRTVVVVPGAGFVPGDVVTTFDIASGAVTSTFPADVGWTFGELGAPGEAPVGVLSGDGSRLLVRGTTSTIFDLATGQPVWQAPPTVRVVVAGWLDTTGARALLVVYGPQESHVLWEVDVSANVATERTSSLWSSNYIRLIVTEDGRHAAFSTGQGTRVIDLVTNAEALLPKLWVTAATRDGSLALGYDVQSGTYSVVDVRRGVRIEWGLDKGPWPKLDAVGPGALVAVADHLSERMAVIDLDLVRLRGVFTRSTGPGVELDQLMAGAFTADGRRFVSLALGSQTLVETDAATGEFRAAHALGALPKAMCVGGDTVAVRLGSFDVCRGRRWVDVWSGDPLALVQTIETGDELVVLAVAPDGRTVYLRGGDCEPVRELIVAELGAPLRRLALPSSVPSSVGSTLSPKGRWLLLPSAPMGQFVVDTTTSAFVGTVPTGTAGAAAVDESDRCLYVAVDAPVPAIVRYDLTSGTPVLTGTFPTPAGTPPMWWLGIDGTGERLWAVSATRLMTFERATGVTHSLATTTGPIETFGPHAFVTQDGAMRRYFADAAGVHLVDTIALPVFESAYGELGPHVSCQRGLLATLDTECEELVLLDYGVAPARRYCAQPGPNGAGTFGMLDVSGPRVAGGDAFVLEATRLPIDVPAMVLAAPTVAAVPGFGGGAGVLCVGPQPQRLVDRVHATDAAGEVMFTIAPNELAHSIGFGVAHGETWLFQVWHRDSATTGGSSLTDALAVYFL